MREGGMDGWHIQAEHMGNLQKRHNTIRMDYLVMCYVNKQKQNTKKEKQTNKQTKKKLINAKYKEEENTQYYPQAASAPSM